MENVAIITGGAGGIGLATAKVMLKNYITIISDANPDRLAKALDELRKIDRHAEGVLCDVTDPASVNSLFKKAVRLGRLRAVVHTAGVSPQMADPRTILKINAIGTKNIVDSSFEYASEDFASVNVASMAAHLMPSILFPRKLYPLAESSPEVFFRRFRTFANLCPRSFFEKEWPTASVKTMSSG